MNNNLAKKCHFCQETTPKSPLTKWIEEKQYQGNHGQTLKEIYIGTESNSTQLCRFEK